MEIAIKETTTEIKTPAPKTETTINDPQAIQTTTIKMATIIRGLQATQMITTRMATTQMTTAPKTMGAAKE